MRYRNSIGATVLAAAPMMMVGGAAAFARASSIESAEVGGNCAERLTA
jgi:hypothetical protein